MCLIKKDANMHIYPLEVVLRHINKTQTEERSVMAPRVRASSLASRLNTSTVGPGFETLLGLD